MASVVLTVADESLLSQIKKACSLLKGVDKVEVIKKSSTVDKDITQTKEFKEAMEDVKAGRVYKAENAEDMFQQILGYVPR